MITKYVLRAARVLSRNLRIATFSTVSPCEDGKVKEDTPKCKEEPTIQRPFISQSIKDQAKAETEESKIDPEELRRRILNAALINAIELGWTKTALEKGAMDIGYKEGIEKLFPNGPIELVKFTREVWIERLKQALELQKNDISKLMTTSDWVNLGLRTQLELIAPYKKVWYQAMILGMQPGNITESCQSLNRVFDEIYKYAGEQQIDMSYYSKRVILGTIFARAELFMLFDNSQNYEETWKFLKEQVNALVADQSLLKWASLFAIDLPKIATGLSEIISKYMADVGQKIKEHKI